MLVTFFSAFFIICMATEVTKCGNLPSKGLTRPSSSSVRVAGVLSPIWCNISLWDVSLTGWARWFSFFYFLKRTVSQSIQLPQCRVLRQSYIEVVSGRAKKRDQIAFLCIFPGKLKEFNICQCDAGLQWELGTSGKCSPRGRRNQYSRRWHKTVITSTEPPSYTQTVSEPQLRHRHHICTSTQH